MDIATINQLMMDKLAPYPLYRWVAFAICLLIYLFKILLTGTHHLITYVVGVYLFHGLVLFLTPKDESIPDPFEEEEDSQNDDNYQPVNVDNNLRPFVRNLPEYSYWLFSMKIFLVSFLLTFTQFTDIPICTPILVVYFIFMVFATVIKLYNHSRKYNYSLFSHEKVTLNE